MALYDPLTRHARLIAEIEDLSSLPQNLLEEVAYKIGATEDDSLRNSVTAENVENLLELARQLLTLEAESSDSFNMHYFAAKLGAEPETVEMLYPDGTLESAGLYNPARDGQICGTVACAVGHAPALLSIPALAEECWIGYSDRVLGDLRGMLFSYCFGSSWAKHDNTPQGASARIVRMLKAAADPRLTSVGLDWYCDLIGGPPGHRATIRTAHLELLDPAA